MFGCANSIVSKEQANQLMHSRAVKFLENKGQMTDDKGNFMPFVFFKASAPGIDMYITENGITYLFTETEKEKDDEDIAFNDKRDDKKRKIKFSRVDMNIRGAVITKENIIREDPGVTDFNFFAPNCPDGIYGVKEYKRITIKDIYPGIDWVLYNSDATGFKYDFVVHAGANPTQIKLIYEWADLSKKRNGNLEIYTPTGFITDHKPISFLKKSNQPVETAFKIENKNEVSFSIGDYDNSQTLVIDPQLTWATYYGGDDDEGAIDVAVDKTGNVYIAGYILRNSSFPTLSAGVGTYFQGVKSNPWENVAIVKFNSAGVRLWATYYSGNIGEYPSAITTDNSGNVYVTGYTNSTIFPLKVVAGAYNQPYKGSGDVFLLKFDPSSVLMWATCYGGTGDDGESGINEGAVAIDNRGDIYITGTTTSSDLTLQSPGAAAYSQAYAGRGIPYSGFGNMGDVFLAKFSGVTNSLIWSTYYGGTGEDAGTGIAIDKSNNVYFTGHTMSLNFPVTNLPGAFNNSVFGGLIGSPGLYGDIFVIEFDGSSLAPIWGTYYGGGKDDRANDIAISPNDDIFIAGGTQSSLPSTNTFSLFDPGGGAYFESAPVGTSMGIILKFNAGSHSLGWASYYGGSSGFIPSDVATDICGNIYITGMAGASMPVFNPGGCSNYFSGSDSGGGDIAVIEFNSNCVHLWATYFGGDKRDWSNAIAVSNTMDVYAVGEYTSTAGIPLTNPGGGAYYQTANAGGPANPDDWAIVKFSPVHHTITQSQVNPVSCSCNGTATVNINCGMPPYNYTWSNGQTLTTAATGNTVNGLCPGIYKVTITDGSCIQIPEIITFNIAGASGSVSLSGVQTNLVCNASCTGSATFSASGGSTPYNYVWSNGKFGQTITGLCAGNYTITVTDAVGCSATAIAVILSPPPFSGQFTKGTANCPGCGCKQWIMVTATGGASPYSYTWPDGYDKRYKNQLCPGAYTVKITDKNGCSVNVNLNTP